VKIAGELTKVRLFVGTLGFSRRPYVEPFDNERIPAWLVGIENSFRHFEGITEEVLIDNARALVSLHDLASREVVFSPTFWAFARY
jgi:transposase